MVHQNHNNQIEYGVRPHHLSHRLSISTNNTAMTGAAASAISFDGGGYGHRLPIRFLIKTSPCLTFGLRRLRWNRCGVLFALVVVVEPWWMMF
jgi:hypothetical protein